MEIVNLAEHGTAGILIFFVWKLWEDNKKLTNTIIQDNSRNISVINSLKETINRLKEEISEIKNIIKK